MTTESGNKSSHLRTPLARFEEVNYETDDDTGSGSKVMVISTTHHVNLHPITVITLPDINQKRIA